MDLEKVWKSIEAPGGDLYKDVKESDLRKLKSKSPLEKIRKNLMLSIIWSVPMCVLFIVVFFIYTYWWFRLADAIVLVFSAIVLVAAIRLYRDIVSPHLASQSLLNQLEFHHKAISGWIRNQEIIGTFIYPISITAGFFLGATAGSGKSMEQLISKTPVQVALAICCIVMTPVCYLAVRKMFRVTFLKYLDELKSHIDELRGE